ncbi:MAG: SDR family oxidoreductase [Candidatus Aminicenantes bacterium]|nr:MAG: SDR family oxidoreductase [Candidatus Aminicenantes bacterium]
MSNKIIITGASSEIGLAICKAIIKIGDQAILQYYRNKDRLIPFCENFKENCQMISVNFNNIDELNRFSKKRDDIDILVNAAAFTRADLLPVLKDEDIIRMINVNILSTVKLCRAVIPSMVARKKGCIVNISSVAALRGNRGQTVYAGTKGFIESFSRTLAAEYGTRGIRVNTVAPGPIETGSVKELLAYAEDEVKKSVASKRLGTPEDVAEAVAFLCSDKASYINGKTISVDGGFSKGV